MELPLPAQRGQLLFEVIEPVSQRLAIALFCALLQIGQHPRAMQQQTIQLALQIQLLACQLGFDFAPPEIRGFDLRLDRFTFPPACHASIIRVYDMWLRR